MGAHNLAFLFIWTLCYDNMTAIKNMHGRLLKVAAPTDRYDAAPYIRGIFDNNETLKTFEGAEFEVFKYLAKALNFTYIMVPSVDGKWGSPTKNGSFNGMIGMVQRKDCDIALGDISINYQRSLVTHMTWPVIEASYCIASHVPFPLPMWQAIFWPFDLFVWICIFGTIVVFGIFVWIIVNRIFENKKFQIGDGVYLCVRSLLYQDRGVETLAKFRALPVLISIWGLFSIVFFASYSGSITSFIAVPKTTKVLDTFKDLADSIYYQIRVGRGTIYEYMFDNSNDPLFQKISAKMHFQKQIYANDDDYIEFQAMMTHQSRAKIGGCREPMVSMFFALPSGESYIHLSQEKVSSPLAHALQIGSDFKDDYDRAIRSSWYFGLYSKWLKDEIAMARRDVMEDEKASGGSKNRTAIEDYIKSFTKSIDDRPYSLDDLQSSFFILISGLLLSAVVFMLEVFYLHFNHIYSIPLKQ